jgi:lysophospholipase L1-like esterase
VTKSNAKSKIWTTAYLAALADPDETPAFLPQPRAFSAHTVRQTVRLRRGGNKLKLVLSNQFGRAPLVIDEVVLSNGDTGSAVPALYRGRARCEIPAGETATSDPVPLTRRAGDELVITCFVAGYAGPAAYLHSAQRSGELASGNEVACGQLTDAERFTSLYWITQVLVDEPATGSVIVAFGDSITRGDGTTLDQDQRYPDHLQRRLLAVRSDGAAVLNAGIGANRLLRPGVGPSMTDRFARDVLSVAEATHVIIMGGINDIAMSIMLGEQRPAADDVICGLRALANQAQSRGIQPLLGTITPILSSRNESLRVNGNEEIRLAVNQAIKAQKDWPVVDFSAALADPVDPTRLALIFDAGDGVHPSDTGAKALADAISLDIFAG